ncbi:MAG: hypothetical protein R3321_05360, partial [Nitrososphaeraceae archaeon]|nr:hypothetical protein [Nitrososphaeraceae archaeon]
MMKHFVKFAIVSAIVFLQVGCLKIETTLNVNKDGSGTIEESVLMSKAFVQMIKEFSQSFGDTTETEEFSLFKEDELIDAAKNYGSEVQYVSGEEISNDEWEGYRAVYSFADLNKVRLEPDPDDKISIGDESTEEQSTNEYYYFKFKPGPVAELTIDRPEIETA